MRVSVFFLCFFLATGCGGTQPPAPTNPKPATTSGSDTCRIDVGRARAAARAGALQAIRDLRGYFSDCSTKGTVDETYDWAKLAAIVGDSSDRNEFAKLAVNRFHTDGTSRFVSCEGFNIDREKKLGIGGEVTALRGVIQYLIWCEGDGVGDDVLAFAKMGAETGTPADRKFYVELRDVAKRAKKYRGTPGKNAFVPRYGALKNAPYAFIVY
jgi:hypothetical protein